MKKHLVLLEDGGTELSLWHPNKTHTFFSMSDELGYISLTVDLESWKRMKELVDTYFEGRTNEA